MLMLISKGVLQQDQQHASSTAVHRRRLFRKRLPWQRHHCPGVIHRTRGGRVRDPSFQIGLPRPAHTALFHALPRILGCTATPVHTRGSLTTPPSPTTPSRSPLAPHHTLDGTRTVPKIPLSSTLPVCPLKSLNSSGSGELTEIIHVALCLLKCHQAIQFSY